MIGSNGDLLHSRRVFYPEGSGLRVAALFELFCDLCAQAIFHMPGIFSFFVEYLSQSFLYNDQLSFVPPKTEP